MEETIGYEALFSREEWATMKFADMSDLDDQDLADDGGSGPKHHVSVEVVHDGYELTCDSCDFWDHTSDVIEADNVKRLHEAFVATLVESWSVEEEPPSVGR